MTGVGRASHMEDCLLDLKRDIAEWIESLQHADQMFHHMMSMEFWSIARTMDDIEPGFWSQYMQNRQEIFQQSMKERAARRQKSVPESKPETPVARRESPFKVNEPTPAEENSERISLFLAPLDRDLPRLRQVSPQTEVRLPTSD
ncbi:hypothetical protein H6G20_09985 [Desertifilum sp. FACHB-1129]|nr:MULTISPECIES: hypothetical protein [Desertifilum]MBD2311988.1 hypothetical protein [Desertifilum sp. FACHB-1129]MCD8489858.1 hypothetical protein [Desertifilum sp.]MDA0211758.1 hypothetical protein [Cyanobacteria bacterium FC1]